MRIALQYMAEIEKQISLLCEEKYATEKLLRDQLEVQEWIADQLFGDKPAIKGIHFNLCSHENETCILFETSKFSDVLFHLVKRYEENMPFDLKRKIKRLEIDIRELCQAWEKLDNYQDMGFIDIGEETVNEFGKVMMQNIENMNDRL